jgi:hypothetical protein
MGIHPFGGYTDVILSKDKEGCGVQRRENMLAGVHIVTLYLYLA